MIESIFWSRARQRLDEIVKLIVFKIAHSSANVFDDAEAPYAT